MERRWVFVLLDMLCVLVGKSRGNLGVGDPFPGSAIPDSVCRALGGPCSASTCRSPLRGRGTQGRTFGVFPASIFPARAGFGSGSPMAWGWHPLPPQQEVAGGAHPPLSHRPGQ